MWRTESRTPDGLVYVGHLAWWFSEAVQGKTQTNGWSLIYDSPNLGHMRDLRTMPALHGKGRRHENGWSP